MSKIEVDAITQQSGSTLTVGGGACKTATVDATTVTLGRSGGTVSLAAGATQSGFGREGSVDWQTSIKTATFTAASGEGYFCNTSGGAFTVNLPSSPSVGDIVAIKDYASTFNSNNLTIGRGGSNMNGNAGDSVRDTANESLTLVYADATKGWLSVEEGTGFLGNNFISATGGTITQSGNFKIHTFTGPGTFTVCNVGSACGSNTVDYLVIAGGGGGGNGSYAGGGGGAGGYRESSGAASGCYSRSPLGACVSALPVSVQGYPIAVGGGAAAITPPTRSGCSGSNSSFSTIISAGGGGGGGGPNSGPSGNGTGTAGGSGGGAATYGCSTGGAGNTPPVSPSQGNAGGNAGNFGGSATKGGGGGGATSAGTATTTPPTAAAGPGGNGATSSINGTPTTRAGGGGGSTDVGGPQGSGGPGGGGIGDATTSVGSGTVNTGSGGGGGRGAGGGGGSGIVIIRYKFQ